jgi:DNA-binding NarL/FixJ family response regulator
VTVSFWVVKSIRPDIAVIICTSFSERINNESADEMGIRSVLMKPVVRSEMAKMIQKVLDEANVISPYADIDSL